MVATCVPVCRTNPNHRWDVPHCCPSLCRFNSQAWYFILSIFSFDHLKKVFIYYILQKVPMCASVCGFMHINAVPMETRRGHKIPLRGVTGSCEPSKWVLGTTFASSVRAVCALNGQPISAVPQVSFLKIRSNGFLLFCLLCSHLQ